MSDTGARDSFLKVIIALLVIALAVALSGCSGDKDASDSSAETSNAEEPAANTEEPEDPVYTSWEVYINDDDSFTEGSITYDIALNLTATNPSSDMAGTYTGTATASTGTNGTVNGAQLTAQAIAQSGQLQFTLAEGSEGAALATLSAGATAYTGTGTITMAAEGSGSIAGAAGGFSNTSTQQITVEVNGSSVTLKVPISGHEYTFAGTIEGK